MESYSLKALALHDFANIRFARSCSELGAFGDRKNIGQVDFVGRQRVY